MDTVDSLPVCQAISKQTGKRCGRYATKGKCMCYCHGGASTGSRTKAGRHRQKMSNWKHGQRSKEFIEEQRKVRKIIRETKALIAI